MDDVVKTYHHENGRKCILGPDGIWRHWDNDGIIPGPRDEVDWKCRMDHWIRDTATTRVEFKDPAPVGYTLEGDPVHSGFSKVEDFSDRGEFGMPTIGHPVMSSGEVKAEWQVAPGRLTFVREDGMRCVITSAGISIESGDTGVDCDAMTPEAERILAKVPYILLHFLEKNAGYARAQTGHDLGLKGIIPDINRKTSALITRIWDGAEEMPGDDVEEIIGDLIGHLLLMLGKMD